MDLHFTQEAISGGTRRTVELRNITGHKDVDIFFDLVGTTAPEPTVLDGFVFGIIFYAMRLGQDVQVHGPVSFECLANLNEFQEAWALWKPAVYRKVKILPSEIADALRQEAPKKAIAAFSGGVDSIFTILRHNMKKLGNASYPLNDAVLMVHGFDVPLNAPGQFAALRERTKPLLDALNLKQMTMRTNLKELWLQDWEDSFMSQLACCLHNYSHASCYALAGSSEPYDALVLPWGSNPATDYLLSGNAMRLIHDGAGYSRTEKVAQIATHKIATEVAKVCWEGKETNKNCGHCEKCIRTQLNFLAVGVPHAPCFDKPFDVRDIATMDLKNDAQLNEVISIVNYAKQHGITEEFVGMLNARIKRYRNPPGKFRKFLTLLLRGEFSTIARKIKMLAG